MEKIFKMGLVFALLYLLPLTRRWMKQLQGKLSMLFRRRKAASIFDNTYIDVKHFYTERFGRIPCISYIGNLDVSRVFEYVNTGFAGKVTAIYQRNFYNWYMQRQEFNRTVFLLDNKVMIALAGDGVEVCFDKSAYAYSENLLKELKDYKAPEKEQDFEINIITCSSNGLDLKQLPVKPTKLDIGLYYNDDFIAVDTLIRERLGKDNDKGIILLHGLPGTGKTTYLRHLIGSLSKKVLFVSPGVAGNLVNPEFIDLLIDNPNAIVVIEDAENIIMDRKFSHNSSVSNLLNISDGLLSDCLNVQIICTFNNALSMVDNALLRKGRLIAKYEFGKLSVDKAQLLSDHLGFKNKILRPMTLAEISNPDEVEHSAPKTEVLGFRREALMN
jgi:hypothetical protein